MKLEWPSYPKMYLICTVYICIGTVLGITGYLAMMQQKILKSIRSVSVVDVSLSPEAAGGLTNLSWDKVEVYRNMQYGFEIMYPKNMAEGIPSVTVEDAKKISLSGKCPAVADIAENSANGSRPKLEGEKTSINNVVYCKYESTGAAAGAVIKNFIYTAVIGKKLLTVALSGVSFPDCGNYAEQKARKDCERTNEEKKQTVAKIMSTLKFTGK